MRDHLFHFTIFGLKARKRMGSGSRHEAKHRWATMMHTSLSTSKIYPISKGFNTFPGTFLGPFLALSHPLTRAYTDIATSRLKTSKFVYDARQKNIPQYPHGLRRWYCCVPVGPHRPPQSPAGARSCSAACPARRHFLAPGSESPRAP